jgi:hypothetical protein
VSKRPTKTRYGLQSRTAAQSRLSAVRHPATANESYLVCTDEHFVVNCHFSLRQRRNSTLTLQSAGYTIVSNVKLIHKLHGNVPCLTLPLITEARIRSPTNQCGICGGQSGCKTLVAVLRFFLVDIIPPMFHTHSFMYHRHHIILATDSVVKPNTSPLPRLTQKVLPHFEGTCCHTTNMPTHLLGLPTSTNGTISSYHKLRSLHVIFPQPAWISPRGQRVPCNWA